MSKSQAAFLFPLAVVTLLLVSAAFAQGGTPPETPTPVPTPSLPEVSGNCLSLKFEACLPGLSHYPAGVIVGIVVLILVVLLVFSFFEGAGEKMKEWGKAFMGWLAKSFSRNADPTRYYLTHFISDFEDPKYQPFTGDDVRRPTLEKIYLPLDLRLEAGGEDEADPTSKREPLGRAFRLGGDREQLADALRRAKKHLALIGGAGSGKSTFLQWAGLACAKDYARQRLNDDEQRDLIHALNRVTYSPARFQLVRFFRLTHPLFPVFIPLGEFDQYCLNPFDPQQPEIALGGELPPNAETLLKFASWRFNRRHSKHKAALTPAYFENRLRAGAVLLFDGVDEVVFERRENVRRAVQGLLREGVVSPRTRVLLTSRPPGYTREAWSSDFLKCDVLPMTDDQRDTLIANLFRAIYSDSDRASDKTRTLIASLDASDERVQAMARTPLLATIFAKLQHNAYRLPDQRARVYKEAVDLILDEVYRKEDRGASAPETGDSGQRLKQLSHIAFELQRAEVGEAGLIREDLIVKVCADLGPAERPTLEAWLRVFLHTLAKNACLIEEIQENYFGFRSHRSFQEFLAGRYLVKEYAPYDLRRQEAFIRQVALSKNRDQWEEPFRLAVGFLAIDAEAPVEHFLTMLYSLGQELDGEAGEWCRAVTALALFDLPATRADALGSLRARIVESAFEVFVRPASPLRDLSLAELGLALARTNDPRLVQPLLEKFTANPPVIRPTQRRAIGLALAALGDPRFTPTIVSGLNVILPKMITIPAGAFLMGTSEAEAEQLKAQEAESWDDEKPQHSAFVSDFAIGQCPVTNVEFRCFVEGAKGYENQAYWSDEGWRWKQGRLEADLSIYDKETRKNVEGWLKRRPVEKRQQPFYWEDSQWNVDNQPVVGITWYEAEAYCQWLRTLTGQNYRLPIEAQWEKAARWTSLSLAGRGVGGEGQPGEIRANLWPWGDHWDKDKCNSEESGFNTTTPVGMYPDGASPLGAQDMVGNVWEWCADWWQADLYETRKEQETRDPIGPASGNARCVRGGSYFFIRGYCRAACRLRFVPADFGSSLGLRVVLFPLK